MAFLDKKIRLPLSRPSARVKDTRLSNQFGKSEWSGALGDLGTMLPLAYALIVFNGFSPERLFLLWGTVYLITGWYFKVPVSVQPLKVMSVVAISQGVPVEMLAGTAVFYGLILLALSLTGAIGWLQKWFTPTLVKGIQLGIGLILARKAVDLVVGKGFILNAPGGTTPINILLMGGLVLILFLFRFRKKIPISIVLVSGGILLTFSLGFRVPQIARDNLISPALPQPAFFLDALVLLIIPQLPLTLGNAVYAASDACHSLWGAQAAKVTPKKLAISIGLGDVGIGLLGGFPMCHGAGGMGAHAMFGGKTGGTTMIIGAILVLTAVLPGAAQYLFLIPVPVLAAMLFADSIQMALLVKKLQEKAEWLIAGAVGLISFTTHNLTVALVCGLVIEKTWRYYLKKQALKPERSQT